MVSESSQAYSELRSQPLKVNGIDLGSRAEEYRHMKRIAIVRIVIIAAIIACGYFDVKVLAAAPLFGMALYTWMGVRGCGKDPERLAVLADQIYFTAYADRKSVV